jgi:hypothetical protein
MVPASCRRRAESISCLRDPQSYRIGFELKSAMRTRHRIDRSPEIYSVVGFQPLFDATRPDCAPIHRETAISSRQCCSIATAAFRRPDPHAQKRKGRHFGRPKFREETPRRRTVRPQPAIVTALHNLIACARMSSGFFERVGNVDSSGTGRVLLVHPPSGRCATHKGRFFDGGRDVRSRRPPPDDPDTRGDA